MKTTRLLGLLACVLLFSGLANARIVTVRDTLDYTDDGDVYFFLPPNVVMDHPPYFRMAMEDWGWTHSMKNKVPADANGIQSATLSVYAWDVDGQEGEIDIISANGVTLGNLQGMPPGAERVWTTTEFDLPSSVVQDLWHNGQVNIFMDIDHDVVGDRVAIGSSTLTVNYTAAGSGASGEPNVAVYRFWSPTLSDHFYTVSEDEKNTLIAQYPDVWTYEGIAYHTFGAAAERQPQAGVSLLVGPGAFLHDQRRRTGQSDQQVRFLLELRGDRVLCVPGGRAAVRRHACLPLLVPSPGRAFLYDQ